MKKLIVIRGPSGSGKSTLAKHLLAQYLNADENISGVICEADHYFRQQDGSYKFDPTKIGHAHAFCQAKVQDAMGQAHINVIIVSNTSMSKWECEPYIAFAKNNFYEVEVIRTPGPWDADVLFKRNVHSVPMKTLEKQISKYQSLENEQEWSWGDHPVYGK